MEEAHPIPQNVTSFEFHLVGDMTLKQFGYLGGGGALGYLSFIILSGLGIPILGGILFALLFIIGAAYAFAPILDRPLDHWTKAFFKAVYSPTRGDWKSPQNPKIKISPDDPLFKNRLENYLANLKIPDKEPTNTEGKPVEPAPNKELVSKLTQDLNSKPLTTLALESKRLTEPLKINISSLKDPVPSTLAPDTSIKLTQDKLITPHLVEPTGTPISTLKPLKSGPENNLNLQTPQPVSTPSSHQDFTPTNFPAFEDNQTESQLDFSPLNNPAYQHLQFVYEAPPAKVGNPLQHTNHTMFAGQTASASITPQPKIQTTQPIIHPVAAPSVSSLFTSVSLPNQTPQPNPITMNPVSQPSQPIPVKEEFPRHPVLQTSSTPQITSAVAPKPTTALPSSEELNKLVELAKEARTLQVKLEEAEKRIKDITTNATNSDMTKPVSADKFDQVYSKLQNLITQTDSLNREAAEVHKVIPPTNRSSAVKVKVVEPIKTQTTQPILTSQPNVINGIVTDNAGNYLEGVIIIIHDKDNLPVRALKTNKIGQFTGTTPLPGGVYTITLEKEHLEFDTLEVNLNGEIIPPLQVSAKVGGSVAHA